MKSHRLTRRVFAIATLWFVVVSVLEQSRHTRSRSTRFTAPSQTPSADRWLEFKSPIKGRTQQPPRRHLLTRREQHRQVPDNGPQSRTVSQTKQVTVLAPIATRSTSPCSMRSLARSTIRTCPPQVVGQRNVHTPQSGTAARARPVPRAVTRASPSRTTTGTTQSATYVSTNADGSSNWTYGLQAPQSTPEGGYQLSAVGCDCSSATTLTASSMSPYVIEQHATDHRAPRAIRQPQHRLSPAAPAVSGSRQGLSGINPSTASVVLVDETNTTSKPLLPHSTALKVSSRPSPF